MFKNKSLKFSTIFIFFAIIVAIVSYFFNIYLTSLSINGKIFQIYAKESQNKTELLKNFFSQKENILNAVLNNSTFNSYLINKDNQITKEQTQELFKSLFMTNNSFMQLRYIDKNGFEKIRIERQKDGPDFFFAHEENLQDKSHRNYFVETKELKKNALYISSFDLNVEYEKIQIPHTPTIRLIKPVYIDDNFDGIVTLNIFAEKILKELIKSELFDIALLDKEGNLIFSNYENLNWSKTLKTDFSLEEEYKDFSQKILDNTEVINNNLMSKKIKDIPYLKDEFILTYKIVKNKVDILNKDVYKFLLYATTIIFIILIPFLSTFIFITNKSKKDYKLKNKELKSSNNLLNQYKKAIDESNIVSIGDLKGNISYVNDKFVECTLYSKEEVIGKPHNLLRGDAPKEVFEDLWKTIKNKKTWHGILKNKKKNGDYYYVNITIMPILNEDNEIVEYIAIRHEITELVDKTQELEKTLREDYLTKEGNRYKLLEDINKFEKPSLALIDINSFGVINDYFGHRIGDILLKNLAKKIKELIPNEFNLYRMYSDEFAILADNCDNEKFIATIKNTSKILSSMPLKILNNEISIHTAYHISFENKKDILKTADILKKYSKQHKNITIYNKNLEIEKLYEQKLYWTSKVKKALEEDRIVPYYQPIYNYETNQIEKYEALVRLIDEDGSIISPYYFLEVAQKTHQYFGITKKVIEKSFEYFKDKPYEFSINLTIKDISSETISSYIITKLKEYNIASKVIFELVESEGIDNFEIINKFIDEVKNLGCKIAIDDFGSGYSNFSYLIKLNADFIKIDGSLIKDILVNRNNKEIVITIIDFARRQGFKTVAEFVSNEDIFNKVKSLGCDFAQGYYISEPKKEI